MTTPGSRTLAFGVALAVAYVLTANFGFSVAFVAEQVTTVWAPTGLAQAALLLWGRALWPAVWIGAFAVNAGTDAPLWTAAAIATGNTLEAVVAAWFLKGILHFDPAFRRTRDAVGFIIVAAALSPVISATIGVATLCAADVQSWMRFRELWFAWWLGDAIGAVVVGPVLLTIAGDARARSRRAWLETASLIAATAIVMHAVFGPWMGTTVGHHPLEYVIFPFLIAAAVRLGPPATSLVVLVAAAVAIWHTVGGTGPFAGPDVHDGLVLLQLFMGIVAVTGLLLAAAIAERQTGERRRAAAHAVTEILSTASSLPDAALSIVRGICQNLEWSHGAVWVVDGHAQRLRCLAVWPTAGVFAHDTKARLFESGTGLPGRVWAGGAPIWVENVVDDGKLSASTAGASGRASQRVRLSDSRSPGGLRHRRVLQPLDRRAGRGPAGDDGVGR